MNKKLLAIFALAFLLRLVLAFIVWHPDVNNHVDWGIRFWQYGPAKFYAPESNVWSYTWPNQPPGTMYIFAAARKLYEGLFGLFSYLHFSLRVFPGSWLLFLESNFYQAILKLPAILSDLGIGYLIYRILKDIKKERLGIIGASLFLFNPVVWYNSAVWGQTDSIINFYAFIAFYFLLKRRLKLALITFLLSFYVKASLLIFFPIFAIVAVRQKYRISEYLISVIVSLVLIALLTFPFSQGEPFGWLIALYQNKVFTQQLHVITANAFNIWSAIAGIHERPDSLPFFGLTYQYWGYILFGLSYLVILYSVFKKQDVNTLIRALALTAFSSWMLLTNMHERYLYPLFPYLSVLVVLNVKLLFIYSSISLINLLNLYNFWWVPRFDVLINFLSFGDRLMPRILGGIMFILFLLFYIRDFLQNRLHRQLD